MERQSCSFINNWSWKGNSWVWYPPKDWSPRVVSWPGVQSAVQRVIWRGTENLKPKFQTPKDLRHLAERNKNLLRKIKSSQILYHF